MDGRVKRMKSGMANVQEQPCVRLLSIQLGVSHVGPLGIANVRSRVLALGCRDEVRQDTARRLSYVQETSTDTA